MISTRPGHAVGDCASAPAVMADAELEHAGESSSIKWRVLVLEDDPVLREAIRDFLTSVGYTVVAVSDGGEGVREVLANDFTLVLCDFMMPGLPGELFYRAVERIRPALCQSFVFMTGHHDDAKTREFIESVNGLVLRKPFPLSNLLDAVTLADVRRTHKSVFDTPDAPAPPPDSQATTPARSHAASFTSSSPWYSPLPADPHPSSAAPEAATGLSLSADWLALALLLFLAAHLWSQHWDARDAITVATAELRAHEAEWTKTSPALQKAIALQTSTAKSQRERAWVASEHAKARWTPALRKLGSYSDEAIEIRTIVARGKPEDYGVKEIRITGSAGGTDPLRAADRFRSAIGERKDDSGNGQMISARFESLEAPSTNSTVPPRADFVIVVPLDSPGIGPAGEKE